jgi:hypothetical protein
MATVSTDLPARVRSTVAPGDERMRLNERNVSPAVTRVALFVSAVVVALLALAAPASAQAEDTDTHVVLTGRAEVRAGERADAVVSSTGRP